MQLSATPNGKAYATMHLSELTEAMLRMNELLEEESALISERRYGELPRLQEEKARLTTLLEAYQARCAGDPEFLQGASREDREELLFLADDLSGAVEENFRKVSTAKAVNQRIAQAIMDVVSEQHRPGTYGKSGTATESDLTLSMNLNQKA